MEVPTAQFETSLEEDKAVGLVLDNKNAKGYLVGEIDVVIGFQEPAALSPEEKEINGAVRSFNFDTSNSKVFIKRNDNNLAVTMLSVNNEKPND